MFNVENSRNLLAILSFEIDKRYFFSSIMILRILNVARFAVWELHERRLFDVSTTTRRTREILLHLDFWRRTDASAISSYFETRV